MFKRIQTLMSSILLISPNITPFVASKESISISGSVEMVDLNEKIPVYLNMVEGHPYAYVFVYIYVNNVLEVSEKIVTKYISLNPYYLKPFRNANEEKDIKISVNYIEENVKASVCSFKLKAPHYSQIYFDGYDSYNHIENDNPTKIEFSMKGSNSVVSKEVEKLYLEGLHEYYLKNARIMDFSYYSIEFTDLNYLPSTCEVRIFTEFEGSDLLYKNNSYTSIEFDLFKVSNKRLVLNNEERFYINNISGMIYESDDYNCYEITLPFFIPLSMGFEKIIPMEIHYIDVGKNHNTYIFKSNILLSNTRKFDSSIFGSVLNYKYEEKADILDVEYA